MCCSLLNGYIIKIKCRVIDPICSARRKESLCVLWPIGPFIFLFMAYSPIYVSVYGIRGPYFWHIKISEADNIQHIEKKIFCWLFIFMFMTYGTLLQGPSFVCIEIYQSQICPVAYSVKVNIKDVSCRVGEVSYEM